MGTTASKPKLKFNLSSVAPAPGSTDRGNLVKRAVDHIENEILQNHLAAGDQLPTEHQLAERLSVSRTVVREAMRILIARGLIETSQGRPARVRPVNPHHVVHALGTFLQRNELSLLDLIEARRPLESETAALAAERATLEDIADLVAANERLKAATTLQKQLDADMEFHFGLAKATGNPIFGMLLETLSDLLKQSRRVTLQRTGKDVALDGHRAVLEAVRRVDASGAREAMLAHLSHAEQDLQEVYENDVQED